MAEDRSAYSVLRRFARQAAESAEERCDLCGERIPHDHRHLLNLSNREILCVCQGCSILFDRDAAGAGTRRLIPTRVLYLTDFEMTDSQWESLGIPVNMAFFTSSSAAGRIQAFYPGPAGPTESLLGLDTWKDLESRNRILRDMAPDTEALLVNRVGERREYFLAPIDECYKLVGIIRTSWRGLRGGKDVWREIDAFFAGLRARARPTGAPDA